MRVRFPLGLPQSCTLNSTQPRTITATTNNTVHIICLSPVSLIVNTCVTNPVSFSVSDVDTGCTPYIAIYTDIAPVRGCALRAVPSARGRGGGFSLYITHYLITC